MKSIHINRLRHFVFVAVHFIIGIYAVSFAEEITTPGASVDFTRQSYKVAFASPLHSPQEKWDLAKSATALSPDQRQDLLALIADPDNGDSWYYALTALVSANDSSSVDVISQVLLSKDNRYYAIALGFLGDKKAIPALKQALAQTRLEHVKEAVYLALRMLDVSTESVVPAETKDESIAINLSTTKTNIAVGKPFVLKVVMKNHLQNNVRIYSRDLFLSQHLAVFSAEGHYVFPIQQIFSIKADGKSYYEIPPSKEVVIEEACSIKIEDTFVGGWPVKTVKNYVIRGLSGTWAYDVAPYVPGKTFGIKIIITCDPIVISENAPNLETEPSPKTRIVSNCVLLTVQSK